MNKARLLLPVLFITIKGMVYAQPGTLSGDLQTNLSIFQRDSSINATNTPLYDNLFTGLETWLTVNYSILGFQAGVRADVFNNSNLRNPNSAYTGAGIGYWYLSKKIDRLQITGGYFYEQFGSGIVYRSYEDRGLGLDYATFGLNLRYELGENILIKAIAGQQKNLFSTFKPVMKGLNAEGVFQTGAKTQLIPGLAVLNRTLDQTSLDIVTSTIKTYDSLDRFVPKYNTYAFSAYNTFNAGNFSWYAEGALKTQEATYNQSGILENLSGNVVFTTLTFSRKGLGITGQFKRTENFVLRTSPNETLNDGVLNFIPPMARQNSLRLPARYSPATQYLGEMAFQFDVIYTISKGFLLQLNYSDIQNLSAVQLWREAYAELEITRGKKVSSHLGAQYVFYNQQAYRNEPLPNLTAYTPFAEITFKPQRKKSMRAELQYQHTKEDYGSWIFFLAEYNIAPRWSFAASDMYNVNPNPEKTDEKNHYYNFFISFTEKANRFSISYVKQVDGINCTGGVCRYEPAFSGVKLGITSSF